MAIAYQVVGHGPTDIVFVRGITGDLLSTWEQPLLVRHVEGLAAFGRVLMLDKRGTGLSDRVREVQSLETTMDDVRAVMDAAGSESAVLWSGGTSTRPERALRGDVSRSLHGPRPHRSQDQGNSCARLSVGSDAGGVAPAAGRGARRLGRAGLPRAPGPRVGPGGRGGRGLPRLVRLAHAPQPEPGCRPDGVPDRDGAGRQRRPRRRPRADAHLPAARAPRSRSLRGRADPGRRDRASCRRSRASTPGSTTTPTRRRWPRPPASSRASPVEPATERVLATILFTDIVGSTELGGAARRHRVARAAGTPSRDRPSRARPVPRPRARHGRGWVLRGVRWARAGRPGRRRPPRAAGGDRPRGAGRPPHRRVRGQRRQDRRHRGLDRRPHLIARRPRRGARLEDGQGPRRRLGPRASRIAASISSRGSPTHGTCSPSSRPDLVPFGRARGPPGAPDSPRRFAGCPMETPEPRLNPDALPGPGPPREQRCRANGTILTLRLPAPRLSQKPRGSRNDPLASPTASSEAV